MIARPRPVQDPVPVWVGGNSKLSRRRVAERAQGWMPMSGGAQLSATARTPVLGSVAELALQTAELRQSAGPRGDRIDVTYSYRGIAEPAVEPDYHREAFAELGKAGVTWVVVSCPARAASATREFLDAFGATYLV